MKTILKLSVTATVIAVLFLNVSIIINKENETKLSLLSLMQIAKADGEDPSKEYDTFCKFCFEPGQVAWWCEEAPQGDCFVLDCMYGVCD